VPDEEENIEIAEVESIMMETRSSEWEFIKQSLIFIKITLLILIVSAFIFFFFFDCCSISTSECS
jgi:hypothetical protein